MCETKTKKRLFGLFLAPFILSLLLPLTSLTARPAGAIAIAPVTGGNVISCANTKPAYYWTSTANKKSITQEQIGTNTDGSTCKGATETFAQMPAGMQYKVGGNNGQCGDTVTLSAAPGTGATNAKYQAMAKNKNGLCVASGGATTVSVAANEADAIKAVAGTTGDATDNGDTPKTSCAIDGIGWLVCNVSNFIAGLVDGLYGYVADTFLSVNTDLVANNSGTYDAWRALLGIANIVFVIIFLIIIFSQATGYGISNYGIKKMLPKLIIGVILINLSYFLCQAAVDISNILGYGLRSFFTSLGASDAPGWSSLIATVLATGFVGGAIAVAALGFGLSFVLLCLLTIIFIALLLLVRQVLIIVCVVAAPIAFAAWLLPNTEKFFKLWWKVFYQMLIVFPLVALVLGASSLTASVVRKSMVGDDSGGAVTASTNNGDGS